MLITSFFIFFFFSSRRRHTRLVSDWSSDVCSSDLAKAREMVVRAAERAASLGANAEAQRAYERAIELADEPLLRAGFEERAGLMAQTGVRPDEAAAHYQRAIDLFEAGGATHPAARVSAR